MPVSRGHRVLLLSTAVAISAGTVGAVAFGDSRDNHTGSPPPDVPALHGRHWQWSFSSGDGDVIQVHARRCPKGHPHRVGSFFYSTTKTVNDKTQTHTSKGSFCAK
jgi:hypothetical protein